MHATYGVVVIVVFFFQGLLNQFKDRLADLSVFVNVVTFTCFLVDNQMRRMISLSCLYIEYEAGASSQLAYLSKKVINRETAGLTTSKGQMIKLN